MIYRNLTLSIPAILLEEYKDFCKKEGLNMSKRIAILIKEDIIKSELNKELRYNQ